MKSSLRLVFSFSIMFFIVLVSVYLFLHSSFFKVDKIYVSGDETVPPEEVISLSSLEKGINIFRVNKELTSRSVEIHPMIKKANINRRIPRSIEIDIHERKVWAVVPANGNLLFIDNEGVLLDRASSAKINNYLIITMDKVPERITLGQVVNKDVVRMISPLIEQLSSDEKRHISQFHYHNKEDSLTIFTLNGTEIRFGDKERFEEKVKFFNNILLFEQQLNEEGRDVLKYVDLRFKGQPIVSTLLGSSTSTTQMPEVNIYE
ncbi:Cell division protein FtsQ [Candidatus Syntrophocurvum alkaliphilum]|uniref:Cell division protein FtsQ n=1 Tax=Candidatus Syntrophocurvum alkaliphilum TaxID=2293317 RepID=A0A6I6DHR8_9FIRM|nr:FtsQ-type POTRA domain-containing protein [Candidatus Syntrophocurvum alkaliphilum]QGT99139.1 Cell division protein FtsQ [Candidatus Syntrophocurvum alkaliphilum]